MTAPWKGNLQVVIKRVGSPTAYTVTPLSVWISLVSYVQGYASVRVFLGKEVEYTLE